MFQAYNLDRQNDWQHEAVIPTWQDDKIAEATGAKLVPTGLGFNFAPYRGGGSQAGRSGRWAQKHFCRSGVDGTIPVSRCSRGAIPTALAIPYQCCRYPACGKGVCVQGGLLLDTDESHIFPSPGSGNV